MIYEIWLNPFSRQEIITNLLYSLILLLSFSIVSCDCICIEVHIYSCISNPNEDIIQSHEETAEQKHSVWHDSKFACQQRYAIVVKLTFVEYNFLKEQYRIRSFQELNWNWLCVF